MITVITATGGIVETYNIRLSHWQTNWKPVPMKLLSNELKNFARAIGTDLKILLL